MMKDGFKKGKGKGKGRRKRKIENGRFVSTNAPGLKKDTKTNIVINTNRSEFLAYVQAKKKVKQFKKLKEKMKQQNVDMKKQNAKLETQDEKIARLEEMVKQLLERQECQSN